MKEAADILKRAADLVGGDRADAHGEAVESLQAIGELWGYLLSLMGKPLPEPLEARDVAILMAGLKIVRAYMGSDLSDENYVYAFCKMDGVDLKGEFPKEINLYLSPVLGQCKVEVVCTQCP